MGGTPSRKITLIGSIVPRASDGTGQKRGEGSRTIMLRRRRPTHGAALGEDLFANATAIGAYFKAGLQVLAAKHDIIGIVRGTGLALGVELVIDRNSRAPAAKQTSQLINRLRDEGVLAGSEGIHGNIVKLRPPLVFRREHVDQAVRAFEPSLSAL